RRTSSAIPESDGEYGAPSASETHATASTTGVDDNNPSASDIVGEIKSSGEKTGLQAFRSKKYGRGFLCAPDLDTDQTVVDELEAIGEEFYRVYLTSSDDGATISTAQTQRQDHDKFNTGFYFPRALVRDDNTQGIKSIPVVAHVAAYWQQADPGKVPAGDDVEIDFTLGLETQNNGQPWIDGPSGVAETLVGKGINPVYDRDGTGPKVWGGRTATSDDAWQYLHAPYLYNYIASRVEAETDSLAYANASDPDKNFFQELHDGVWQFMYGLWDDGAFAGALPPKDKPAEPDKHAFSVQTGEELLSDQDKNNGIVRVKIWFKEALTAETIDIEIAKRVHG
ncbi:MAG: hypothetical protein ABEN55_15500, partial [Bradymonadaceae bacterium]